MNDWFHEVKKKALQRELFDVLVTAQELHGETHQYVEVDQVAAQTDLASTFVEIEEIDATLDELAKRLPALWNRAGKLSHLLERRDERDFCAVDGDGCRIPRERVLELAEIHGEYGRLRRTLDALIEEAGASFVAYHVAPGGEPRTGVVLDAQQAAIFLAIGELEAERFWAGMYGLRTEFWRAYERACHRRCSATTRRGTNCQGRLEAGLKVPVDPREFDIVEMSRCFSHRHRHKQGPRRIWLGHHTAHIGDLLRRTAADGGGLPVSDGMGRKLEILARTNRAAARVAAQQYLAAHPSGSHAAFARELCCDPSLA